MKKCLITLASTVGLLAASAVAAKAPFNHLGLPACTSTGWSDVCRLLMTDGDFSSGSLSAWQRVGLPGIGYDKYGDGYAALPYGSAISQKVPTPAGSVTSQMTYAVNFAVMAETGEGSVAVSLALTDDQGRNRVELGGTTVKATPGVWTYGELYVSGQPYGGAAHVQLQLANTSVSGTQVQVDNVMVVQNAQAEGVGR